MIGAYDSRKHSALKTDDYVFHQLIPYIGNKRKLLRLIRRALVLTGTGGGDTFLDLFAGSGVVSRFAKSLGYRVLSNDWEPYAEELARCAVECNRPPGFRHLGGYDAALARLNALPPREDWVTRHLCPRDDLHYDADRERMFYMRKNGMRLDAIREQIAAWEAEGMIDVVERACLIAPLLYQASYRSNTSGVFKGFHRGWGGATQTALYRIGGDLELQPALFLDRGEGHGVFREDAAVLGARMGEADVAYLDPPYNQHPYGSNYHLLNSITLWDKPPLNREISRGTKSAIRRDWRTERRSAYNSGRTAIAAYRNLVESLPCRWVLTSYSTDGTIDLRDLLEANSRHGSLQVETQGYKRYRVSTQRFSSKPMNLEFVLVLDKDGPAGAPVDSLLGKILSEERGILCAHPESAAP